MPFYDDKRKRPADRRDDVVEAIKQYKLASAEPKQPDSYGESDEMKKAVEAVRTANSWSNDYWSVYRWKRMLERSSKI